MNAQESLDGFRAQVEHLFDDSMERASGWYKRKVQIVLAVLATIVVIGLNVDTVQRRDHGSGTTPALRESSPRRRPRSKRLSDAKRRGDEIEALGLPVGWGDNAPDSISGALPGWIIAIAALNLGAPFWFDLLSRLARLRGSGLQERPRALSDTTATERPERKPIVQRRPSRHETPRPAAGLAGVLAVAEQGALGLASRDEAGERPAARLGPAVELRGHAAVVALVEELEQRRVAGTRRCRR